MKLLTYETDEEMRTCLERYRLAWPEPASEVEEGTPEPIGE